MSPSPLHRVQARAFPVVTRREALGALAGLGVFLSRAPHGSAARHSSVAVPATLSGDTYVGVTSDPATFVAIEVHDDRALAFLSDGPARQIDAWVAGSLRDGRLSLTTEDGAAVFGAATAAGIDGRAVLVSGRRLRFRALPAVGVAGLYSVRVFANGSIQGAASTGARLDGELMLPRALAPLPANVPILNSASQHVTVEPGVRFAIRIMLPDGHVVPLELRTASAEPDQLHLILLLDGAARGQNGASGPDAWNAPFSLETR